MELVGVPTDARVVCGIGPKRAFAATRAEIERRRPGAILHIGIAGMRRASGLSILTSVIGDSSVDCDGPEAALAPEADLLDALLGVLPDAVVTAIGTSHRVGGTTGVQVEAMEGHAVLRAAAAAAVPAVELRVISNEIEESDRARWQFEEAFTELARVSGLAYDAITRLRR